MNLGVLQACVRAWRTHYGKNNDGEHTPPISLLLEAHTSESDMADLVAAPEPADMSNASPSARFASQASDPIHGLETVDLTTGDAHSVPQPAPGHEIRHDQASTHLSPYPLTPLTAASQARFTSQVADPIHGLTAVVPTTGSVIHALHPDPGHEIRRDQASRPPVTVLIPPLIAASAARFPGMVPSHFVGQNSGCTTGDAIHASQPAAMHAAARNLESKLLGAVPPGSTQPAATPAIRRCVDQRPDLSPPWSAGSPSSVGMHSAYPPAAMQAVLKPPGCGQLTIQVLTACNRGFLDRLQRAASAFPLYGNPDLRNDLCLDQTIRDGPFLTSFLTAGGVERFAGSEGSLLEDPQL
jgi:hypothetical protein